MASLCRCAFLLTPWLCYSLVWGSVGGPSSFIRSGQQIPRFLGLWVDPLPLQSPILILPLWGPLSVCATGYEKKKKNEKAGHSAERSMSAFGKAESLISRFSLSCLHPRRAKVKKGVNILSTRTSEPRQWDVKQEMGNGGKHATTAVVCQRLAPGMRNR